MSDSREFDRDPNLPRNRPVDRSPGGGSTSGWIIAGVVAVALLGLAAYSYRGEQMTSATSPATTMGQSTRAPVPSTPLVTPVVPAPRPQ